MESTLETETKFEENPSSAAKSHDVAPVIENEETRGRESNNAATPTRDELLQQRLKNIFGRYAPSVSTCKWLIIVAAVLCIVFVIGMAVGVTAKRATELPKKFTLAVVDRDENSFEDVNIYDGVAMFWTPSHKGIVRCTTIHDFNTGWTGIHDEEHDLCFLRKLNRTDFPSLDLLQKTVAARRRVLVFTPVINYNWTSTRLNESSIHHLSSTLQWKCTGKGRRTFYMIPANQTTAQKQTDSCKTVCLPHYALRSTATDFRIHFDMPSVDCVHHDVC